MPFPYIDPVRCPYCVTKDNFLLMIEVTDDVFLCQQCGHCLAMLLPTYICECKKIYPLAAASSIGLGVPSRKQVRKRTDPPSRTGTDCIALAMLAGFRSVGGGMSKMWRSLRSQTEGPNTALRRLCGFLYFRPACALRGCDLPAGGG